jgi:hypothetical protein
MKYVLKPWNTRVTRCVSKTMNMICVNIKTLISWKINKKTMWNWQRNCLVATRQFIENKMREGNDAIENFKWLNKY